MRAALALPLSPAVPEALPGTRGARGERAFALALALAAAALHARVLSFPALAVGDAGLGAFAGPLQALRTGGPGALALHLEGVRADSGLVPVLSRSIALFLHAGASALVFGLARRLGVTRAAGALAALFFAFHPLRVEAVAWLSQRGVLLGSFFFLLASFLAL